MTKIAQDYFIFHSHLPISISDCYCYLNLTRILLLILFMSFLVYLALPIDQSSVAFTLSMRRSGEAGLSFSEKKIVHDNYSLWPASLLPGLTQFTYHFLPYFRPIDVLNFALNLDRSISVLRVKFPSLM